MRFDIDYYKNINLDYLNALTGYNPQKEEILVGLKTALSNENYSFDNLADNARKFFVSKIDEIESTISNVVLYQCHKACRINNNYDTRTNEKMNSKPIHSPKGSGRQSFEEKFEFAKATIKRDVGIEEIISKYHTNSYTVKHGKGTCLCPFHNEKTPSFTFNTEKNLFKCFGCDEGGDQISFVMRYFGLKFSDAVKKIDEDFGLHYLDYNDYEEIPNPDKTPIKPIKAEQNIDNAPTEETADFTDFFLQANKDIEKTDYHRGISLATLNRFKIGYVEQWRHPKTPNAPPTPRLIIPTSKSSYLARDTRKFIPEYQKAYSKSKVGSIHIFNQKSLQKANQPIFVVEGEIDALSVIDVDGEAIALGTTAKAKSLLEIFENDKPKQPVILALDNDEAGQKACEELSKGLAKLGIPVSKFVLDSKYKDANEALQDNRENLRQAISQAKIKAETEKEQQEFTEKKEYISVHPQAKIEIAVHITRANGKSLGYADIIVNDRFSFPVWIMQKHDGLGKYLLYPNYINSKGQYSSYVQPTNKESAKMLTNAVLSCFDEENNIVSDNMTIGEKQPQSTVKIVRMTPLEKNNQLNHAVATVCLDNIINVNAVNVKQYSGKDNNFVNYVSMPQFIQKAHDVITFKDKKMLDEIMEKCVKEFSSQRAKYYSTKKSKEMSL